MKLGQQAPTPWSSPVIQHGERGIDHKPPFEHKMAVTRWGRAEWEEGDLDL